MTNIIFMIHGMWGGGWYWDKYKEYFEERGYRCITPYLRDHNIKPDDPAPPGLGKISLIDYAKDLEEEIGDLDEKPIIMGHSMGGLLAQILASRGLAKKAVLLTPASPAGIVALTWSVLVSFQEVLFRWGFWNRPHKLSYDKAVYAMMEKLPEEERVYVYNRGVWESGRAATEIGFWFAGVKGAQLDSSKVNCPILVVAGSDDRITPAKVVRKVAQYYSPYHTYMEFGNHAHWLIREPGWEKIAGHVYNWLKEDS